MDPTGIKKHVFQNTQTPIPPEPEKNNIFV